MCHQMLASQISSELFAAGREKALWVTLWGWKFHVRVQRDCFKQEELDVRGRGGEQEWLPRHYRAGPDGRPSSSQSGTRA